MKCDKCGKPIRGTTIVSGFGFYHLPCFGKRPLNGRIVDPLERDLVSFNFNGWRINENLGRLHA